MAITVTPSGQICGAAVTGLDLTAPMDAQTVADVRSAWLEHKVLSFPDQPMSDDDLERFTLSFGPFGVDPFFGAVDGRINIAAIHRLADETASIFAENWHADWTFQQYPPDGTCLFGKVIPPAGGNTEFVDQAAVYRALPDDLRAWADQAIVIHSARGGYAPDGMYGDADTEPRAMKIITSDEAYATHRHPLVRVHPETGQRTLYSTVGYIIGVEGLPEEEGRAKLFEIYGWQTREEFRYVHQWSADMLVMWDNRWLLHRATGGYDGHERLLHRTTVGYNAAVR